MPQTLFRLPLAVAALIAAAPAFAQSAAPAAGTKGPPGPS